MANDDVADAVRVGALREVASQLRDESNRAHAARRPSAVAIAEARDRADRAEDLLRQLDGVPGDHSALRAELQALVDLEYLREIGAVDAEGDEERPVVVLFDHKRYDVEQARRVAEFHEATQAVLRSVFGQPWGSAEFDDAVRAYFDDIFTTGDARRLAAADQYFRGESDVALGPLEQELARRWQAYGAVLRMYEVSESFRRPPHAPPGDDFGIGRTIDRSDPPS